MRTSFALLVAAAASASAATISYSNTLTVNGTNTYSNLTLSKFNSNLGTLTGVTLTVNELSVDGQFSATAINGNGILSGFTTTATLRQAVGSGLGFTTITGVADAADDLVITPGVGTILTQDIAQTFSVTNYYITQNAVTNVDASSWANYTAAGSGQVVTFQLKNNPSASVTAPTGQFTTTPVTGFADITVTYTYEVPVPEASTYGLILGGLALAGAAVRRRQKAAK